MSFLFYFIFFFSFLFLNLIDTLKNGLCDQDLYAVVLHLIKKELLHGRLSDKMSFGSHITLVLLKELLKKEVIEGKFTLTGSI